MGEWKKYKLREVAEIIKDTYIPVGNSDYAYIGLEHIEQESLRLNSVGVSSDVRSNKFKFKANDVLFGKLRPYFRKVVKPQFDGICSTDIWVFRAKKGFDQDFLFYFLANWDFVNTANNAESGTRMPRADWSFLKETEWNLPPLPEQKSIASVLSSLDDKIDLLHRQNKTLEALAETLFRQWFVEEAEDGWEGKLGDYGKIICGKTPSKKVHSYFGGNIPFIKIPDMHGKTFIFDTEDTLTEEGANSQQNKFLPPKSICVSCIATVGLVSMNAFTCQTNQQINSIVPNKEIYRYFLYLKFTTMKEELLAMASGGTATDNLNTGDFSNIDIIKPDDKVLKVFHNQVQVYFEKIFANQIQIRTLTRLRDTLLPKLMSRKVRVKDAERFVKEKL
ncbi:MAG: restriction endonuclease subunit S [Nitrospirota bacterium]